MRDPPPYSEGSNGVQGTYSGPHSLRAASNTHPVDATLHDLTQSINGDSQIDFSAALVVPPRRSHHIALASNNPYRSRTSSSPPIQGQSLDGAQDIDREARVTSTTWSTISKVSHRIFSDSSDTSRTYATAKYNHEFNQLATRYGLQQLTFTSQDNMNDKSSTKSTNQARRHGWFARKFLPRPTTTYTYKSRTTYKPIPRKKSFSSRSSSMSDDMRRNILEGKTLDETCKLGGLGVLMLPNGYCLETPTLPTCLSATATYLLNHGVNASGLFRVSGQSSIVNALYDYYAHQFGHAGSPTKVQTTVQPGQLPLHIEYTLPDIATFFKKVLKGLSGGLLGSLEIFEAISQALLKMDVVPSMSAGEMKTLRAKLIALSLLSINSLHRFSLIQAVLGLFAYLADQAEQTRATIEDHPGSHKRDESPSGLMGYQAMGVCLGPLLIGDLLDDMSGRSGSQVTASREGIETKGKSKKKASNKLDNSANLNVLVDRAHLSANMMQLLLMIWRDVVQQLRLLTASESAVRNSIIQQPSSMPHLTGARNPIKVTDEELLFLKMMRSGEVPLEYPFDFIIKRKVTAKAKSSMPLLIRDSPPAQPTQREWFHATHGETQAQENVVEKQGPTLQPAIIVEVASEEPVQADKEEGFAANIIERGPSYRRSIASLDDMIAGQILPPREDTQYLSKAPLSGHRSPSDPYYTPTRGPSRHRSLSTEAAGQLDQLCDMLDDVQTPQDEIKQSEFPTPPRRGKLPPPVDSPSFSKMKPDSRRSSAHSRRPSGSIGSSTRVSATTKSRKASKDVGASVTGVRQARKPSGCASDFRGEGPKIQMRSYRSSRSNSGAGLEIRESAPKFQLPNIPPFEEPEISQQQTQSVVNRSPLTPKTRPSLLPVPSSSGGSAADVLKKPSGSFRRPSIFTIVKKDSIGPSKIAVPVTTKEPRFGMIRGRDTTPRSKNELAALQPLSAQSLNSLTLRDLQALDPLSPQLSNRTHSGSTFSIHQDTQNEQPDNTSKAALESRNVTNSTLFAEVARLKRQMDQKEEVLLATSRALEAATMAKEDGPTPPSGSTTPKRGSWNKGTLSHEVKTMKNQRDSWRLRAEMAEKRLSGIEETGSWNERRVKKEV